MTNPFDVLPSVPTPDMCVEPARATPQYSAEPDLKQEYQAQAFAQLGVSGKEFEDMDPIERNGLINAAYARMYQSDPESLKWAGMAAMASDKAGTGMMESYALAAGQAGGAWIMDAMGAPSGAEVEGLLSAGNAGIFNDMYWQHLAFQHGGVAELEKAAKAGSLTSEQLAGWEELSKGQGDLKKAQTGGDPAAIEKAQDEIWGGNGTLLHAEQKFVQNVVYDKNPESREAFQFLSGNANPMGVASPVPGGTSFNDYREGISGQDDVGDFDQRWGWIESNMLPEYRAFEADQPAMTDKMDTFIDREHESQWAVKGGDIADQADDALPDYAGRMEHKLENKAGKALQTTANTGQNVMNRAVNEIFKYLY